ncbi:MAG: sulfotransferase [Pseudomonadales bacterium]|nr:sulfotransferase [Pseudomonadales bacterium]
MSELPSFFLVGAAKSGTTSLWLYLRQHPEIFFPKNKEPNYFAYAGRSDLNFPGPAEPETIRNKLHPLTITQNKKYRALFQGVSEKAVGEASVRYLYFPRACERIAASLPDAKIIIMLRNPIDRLYSHFLMMKGMYRLEPLSLPEALVREDERIAANWDWDWHYVHVSMYFEQVRRYIDHFGDANVRVYIYEDFCRNPLDVIRQIFQFLEVDPTFVPDMTRRGMEGYWPKSFTIDGLLRSPASANTLTKIFPRAIHNKIIRYGMRLNKGKAPAMPGSVRLQLQELFQRDVTRLEQLLEKKLPW